jgi:hypothetical protein
MLCYAMHLLQWKDTAHIFNHLIQHKVTYKMKDEFVNFHFPIVFISEPNQLVLYISVILPSIILVN